MHYIHKAALKAAQQRCTVLARLHGRQLSSDALSQQGCTEGNSEVMHCIHKAALTTAQQRCTVCMRRHGRPLTNDALYK
jgi:hypothetical protein